MPPGGQQQPHQQQQMQQPQLTPQQVQQYQQQMQQHQLQKSAIQHQHELLRQHQSGPVRTRDLRDEMPVTKAKAIEEMSSYQVFRFEEVPDDEEEYFSGDDDKRESTRWVRVICVQVVGMTKEQIAHEIRKLNQQTINVLEKKASLTNAQQRHIEATLEEQKRFFDSQTHETNLVQLDHNLDHHLVHLRVGKKKDRDSHRSKYGRHDKHDRHDKHEKHRRHGSKSQTPGFFDLLAGDQLQRRSRHGQHRSSHGHTKDFKSRKVMEVERAYIMAYFKTSPRPEVEPIKLYYEIQASREAHREAREKRALQPPPPPEPAYQHDMSTAAPFVQLAARSASRGRDGRHNSRSRSRKPSRGSPRGRHSPGNSPKSNKSSTFSHSDDMSSTSSVSDGSSRSGSPHRGRTRHPRKPLIRPGGFHDHEEARFFGVGPVQHRRHRFDDFVGGRPIESVAVDMEQIEQIKTSAYEQGRAAERADRRELVQDIALAAAVMPKPWRHEHVAAPLHVARRRTLDEHMAALEMEDSLDTDDGYDVRYPVAPRAPPPRRRGPPGGFRRRGVEHVPRGDVEAQLDVERRRREQNEYLSRRSSQGGGVYGQPRARSYERTSLSSDDGVGSPDFVDLGNQFGIRRYD